MQLVPVGNARTYHTKNSLDVSMANGDDKRGYTDVLASSASGKMLPLQVIYGGAEGSLRALPNVLCRATAAAKGFVFAQTPTHWSSQGSMRKYIIGMINPYVKSMIKASLNRPFKAAVKAAYHLWYAQDVGQQLQGHVVGEVKLAARATAKGAGASSSAAVATSSIQDVAAQATVAEEYLQIDEQLAL
ncbi:unnamed protein product [Sphagnum balticum]